MFQVVAGYDRRDSTSLDVPVPDYAAALTGDIRGLRIGVPREYFIEGIEPAVETAVRAAITELEHQGAEVARDQPAAHALRAARLLLARPGRGQRQSGPL